MAEVNTIRWEQDSDGVVVLTLDDPGQSATVNKQRVISEHQIQLLIQFIRHWQSYDTTP